MAVLHGVGKNGKSTLVELFQDLLGDYSGVANPNTIMQQRYGDATVQYQVAELTGVRFVGMAETKREVQLEESVVKQITGNDTISARSPYGRPFGYRPQFKIWFSTNHKPEIPDGSEAIWDRIKLIPFTKRFDGAKADADLPEKLREELPGARVGRHGLRRVVPARARDGRGGRGCHGGLPDGDGRVRALHERGVRVRPRQDRH